MNAKTLTKAALIAELEAARIIIDQQRNELASLRKQPTEVKPAPSTTKRPVLFVGFTRANAFEVRNHWADVAKRKNIDRKFAVQPMSGKPGMYCVF